MNLILDIFCKSTSSGCIPRDDKFEAPTAVEDVSTSCLFSLSIPPDNSGRDMRFAGAGRVSVGFMQTVIELLNHLRDVLFDWSVGEGVSYFSGDYCGRHVIGLEDRPVYRDSASEALREVHNQNNIVEALADVENDEKKAEVEIRGEEVEEEDPYAILADEELRTPSRARPSQDSQ